MEMQMQPLQATFSTQAQAESVVRKLSALRADRFRLERADGSAGSSPGREPWNAEIGSELGADAAEFTLAALVPTDALAQARTVIRQAGGQLD
ncbi:hypothetical protein [Cohnella hongkongensis]|uniref:Uncharacterized protein n=1 Tax=Cohnella hongkongensis TaxID=178337 RepID=A0ABV9FEV9_9BACL